MGMKMTMIVYVWFKGMGFEDIQVWGLSQTIRVCCFNAFCIFSTTNLNEEDGDTVG